MFDIGWSELLLVGVIALVVVGPKDLPGLLYTIGQWVRRARMVASNFQSTVDQMMQDAELDKTRQELETQFRENTILPQMSYMPPEVDPPQVVATASGQSSKPTMTTETASAEASGAVAPQVEEDGDLGNKVAIPVVTATEPEPVLLSSVPASAGALISADAQVQPSPAEEKSRT